MTGNPEVVPEDFALVTSLIGVNQDDCDVSEFFAHCFAMSLLIEPDLVTVHTPLFREVFWHEYAKIPRHTSQNSIAAGNLE